jgi:hypothetical protein
MKVMTTHSSSTDAQQTSPANKNKISNSLKRNARALINDNSIDGRGRNLIRYALMTSDPWLPELVRRANAGEPLVNIHSLLGDPGPLKTT